MWESSGLEDVNTTISKPASQKRNQTILPIFIKFLHNLDDDFKWYGETVQMVSFIARVKSQNISSTRVTYKLTDFSGELEGHFWLNSSEDTQAPEVPNIMINSYVRVVGTLKAGDQQNSRRVFILRIVPIKSFDELLLHNLQLMACKCEFEKKYDEGDIMNSDKTGTNHQLQENTYGHVGNPFQISVYKTILKSTNPNGMHVDQIQNIIKSDRKLILDALHHLVQEGHLYTTIADDYYKATDDF